MVKYPGSRVTMDRFIKKNNVKDYRTAKGAQGKGGSLQWEKEGSMFIGITAL